MELEVIANCACHTGENPLWHPDEQRLYWLDIPQGRLLHYDPDSGHSEICFQSPEAIGGFTAQVDGALLPKARRSFAQRWDKALLKAFADVPSDIGVLFQLIDAAIGRIGIVRCPKHDMFSHLLGCEQPAKRGIF